MEHKLDEINDIKAQGIHVYNIINSNFPVSHRVNKYFTLCAIVLEETLKQLKLLDSSKCKNISSFIHNYNYIYSNVKRRRLSITFAEYQFINTFINKFKLKKLKMNV